MSDATGRPADDAKGSGTPDGSGPTDVDALKAEIDQTRQQLGRTVDELSARLDVPARTKERAARVKDTAVETYRESPPLVIAGTVALVGALIGLVAWRRRRATRKGNR